MQRFFVRFSWFLLAYNIGVILWGAYVRATGSGAGCGEHWPLCNGEVLPRSAQLATLIEYTHRASSGVALILVVALAALAFRWYPARHSVRTTALWALGLTLLEALLGAGLVLLGHVAGNISNARGVSLAVHLINTLLLLAALTLTAWHSSRDEPLRLPSRWVFWTSVAGLMLIGVSGAISALGDTLFTAPTLAEGFRQDFADGSHLFLRLRILHPIFAVLIGLTLFALALRPAASPSTPAQVKRFSMALLLLIALQLSTGTANLLLRAPVWLQMVHLLLADLIWIVFMLRAAATASVSNSNQMA
jgi:cytochrome c oxidase assembly protein subunit 15